MSGEVTKYTLIATIFAIPISYLCSISNVASSSTSSSSPSSLSFGIIRPAVVTALWIVYLGIPLWCMSLEKDGDGIVKHPNEEEMDVSNDTSSLSSMPLRQMETMMAAVLSFILPLKLTQQILFSEISKKEKNHRKQKKKTKVEDNDDDATNKVSTTSNDQDADKDAVTHPSFKGLLYSAADLLYYAVPISWSSPTSSTMTSKQRKKKSFMVLQNIQCFVIILLKIMFVPVLDELLRIIAARQPYPSIRNAPIAYYQLLILFAMEVIAMYWTADIQCLIVNIASFGYLEVLSINNMPFLFTSITDFWNHRYNMLIHTLLKETVYIPMRAHGGYSKAMACFATFLTSGLLHAWVAHFTFGYGIFRACLFFLCHSAWIVLVEGTLALKSLSRTMQYLLTVTYFLATLPLYFGLFVEAMPEWLENNNPIEPLPKLPFIHDFSNLMVHAIRGKYG